MMRYSRDMRESITYQECRYQHLSRARHQSYTCICECCSWYCGCITARNEDGLHYIVIIPVGELLPLAEACQTPRRIRSDSYLDLNEVPVVCCLLNHTGIHETIFSNRLDVLRGTNVIKRS